MWAKPRGYDYQLFYILLLLSLLILSDFRAKNKFTLISGQLLPFLLLFTQIKNFTRVIDRPRETISDTYLYIRVFILFQEVRFV